MNNKKEAEIKLEDGSKLLRSSFSSVCLKKNPKKLVIQDKKATLSQEINSKRKRKHLIEPGYTMLRHTNQSNIVQGQSITSRCENFRPNNTQPLKEIRLEAWQCERFDADARSDQPRTDKTNNTVFRNSAFRDLFKRNAKGSLHAESLKQTIFDMKSYKEVVKQLDNTNKELVIAKTKAEDRKQYIKRMYDMMKLQEHRYNGELAIKQNRINRLQSICKRHIGSLAHVTEETRELGDRMLELDEKVNGGFESMANVANKKLADYRLRVNSLKASLAMQSKIMDTLKNEMGIAMNASIGTDKELIAYTKKIIADSNSNRNTYQRHLDKLNIENTNLKERIKTLQRDVEHKNNKINEVSEELSNTIIKLTEAQQQPFNSFVSKPLAVQNSVLLTTELESALLFVYNNFNDVIKLPLEIIEKIDILKNHDFDITRSAFMTSMKKRIVAMISQQLMPIKTGYLKTLNLVKNNYNAFINLSHYVKQYRARFDSVDAELYKFKLENVRLKEAVRAYKEDKKNSKAKVLSENVEVKRMNDAIAELEAKLKESDHKIEFLNKTVIDLNATIAIIGPRNALLSDQMAALNQEYSNYRIEYQNEFEKFNALLALKDKILDKLTNRYSQALNKYNAKVKNITQIVNIKLHTSENDHISESLVCVSQKLDTLRLYLHSSQQIQKQTTQQYHKTKQRLALLLEQPMNIPITPIEEKLEDLRVRCTQVQEVCTKQYEKLETANKTIIDLKFDTEKYKEQLNRALADKSLLNSELVAERKSIDDLISENQFLTNKCNLLDQKVNELDIITHQLASNNTDSRNSIIQTAINDKTALNSTIGSLNAEIVKLNQNNEQKSLEVETLKDTIALLNERIFEYEINGNNLQQLVEDLQSRNEGLAHKTEVLMLKNEKSHIKIQHLSEEVESTQQKLRETCMDKLAQAEELENTRSCYEASMCEITSLKDHINEVENTHQQKLYLLMNRIDTLSDSYIQSKLALDKYGSLDSRFSVIMTKLSGLVEINDQYKKSKLNEITTLIYEINNITVEASASRALVTEKTAEIEQLHKKIDLFDSKIMNYDKIHILIRLFIKTMKNEIENVTDEFMNSHTYNVLMSTQSTEKNIQQLLGIELDDHESKKLFKNALELKSIYINLKDNETQLNYDISQKYKESLIADCITSIIYESKVEAMVDDPEPNARPEFNSSMGEYTLEQQIELLLEQNSINEKTIAGLEQLLTEREKELIEVLSRMKQQTQSNLDARVAKSMIELSKDSVLLNSDVLFNSGTFDDLAMLNNMSDTLKDLITAVNCPIDKYDEEKIKELVSGLQELSKNIERRFLEDKNAQKDLEALISDLNAQIAQSMEGMLTMHEAMKQLRHEKDCFNSQFGHKQQSLENLKLTQIETKKMLHRELKDIKAQVHGEKTSDRLYTSINDNSDIKVGKYLGLLLVSKLAMKRQCGIFIRIALLSKNDSYDQINRENSMLKDELIKLTKKLVDVENQRAELEEEYSKDFNTSNMLHSLDKANTYNNITVNYKPSIKPVIGKEGASDPEVIDRITYYVELVNKYFDFDYKFTFKNYRQFNYVIKSLKTKMRDEKAHIEFLNEVKQDYKHLLDSKCKEHYNLNKKLTRISENGTELSQIKELSLEDMIDKFYEHDDRPENHPKSFNNDRNQIDKTNTEKKPDPEETKIIMGYKKEILRLNNEIQIYRNQVEDFEDNRKGLLKQKEKIYEQYLAIKRENEDLKRDNKQENTQMLKEHIAATLFQFLGQFTKGNHKDARLLLDIIITLLCLTEDNAKLLVSYFGMLEPKRKSLSSFFK